jgi:hypothetical protein
VPGYQGLNAAHNDTGRHVEIQAVLGSTLDRILRYRAAIRKDRYRPLKPFTLLRQSVAIGAQEALEQFGKPRVRRTPD